jgi:hypothetical protein
MIHRFSLVKAAMNAPRLCAKTVLSALAMPRFFYIFQFPKAKQKPLRTCQLVVKLAIKK